MTTKQMLEKVRDKKRKKYTDLIYKNGPPFGNRVATEIDFINGADLFLESLAECMDALESENVIIARATLSRIKTKLGVE